jgi:hypothetical protein
MGAPFVTTQHQSELSEEIRSLAKRLFKISLPETAPKTRRRFPLFSS